MFVPEIIIQATVTHKKMNVSLAANTEIETLYSRLYNDYLESSVIDSSNYKSQLADGSWSDINYASRVVTYWPPMNHLYRIRGMVRYYCEQKDKNSALSLKLLNNIKSGISFWQVKKPVSDNWFYNDIGKQVEFIPILILMRNYLPATTINDICTYFVIASANNTGANLLEMASSTAIRGVLQNDVATISASLTKIQSVISPVTKGTDGIQADNSFLFHGLQLFSTLYNVSIMRGAAFWVEMTNGLSFGLPIENKIGLRNAILKANRWFYYGDIADFGTVGRRVSQINGTRTSDILPTLKRMAKLDPENESDYVLMMDNITGNKKDSLSGNQHFYRADCMVQRKPGYYFSVKMCSSRTSGTESGNGENLKGFWLPFGATCLMKNGDEFRQSFPLWDWTKVPGVTCTEEVPTFGWSINQPTQFVGGVSNGKNGACTMQLNKQSTQAHKSWFMFDNEIVALGAGITSTNTKQITTSLAQNKLHGKVWVNGLSVTNGDKVLYSNVKSVYNDSTAYVFPTPAKVYVSNSLKSGNWYQINNSQRDTIVKDSIFSVYLNHGIAPVDSSYAYIVVPRIGVDKLAAYINNNPLKVLNNNKVVQAVSHSGKKMTGVVFYAGGQIILDNGYIIKSYQPCAIMVDLSTDSLIMHVSDPGQTSTSALFQIYYNALQYETIQLSLPTGNKSGASVRVSRMPLKPTGINVENRNVDVKIFVDKKDDKLRIQGLEQYQMASVYNPKGQLLITQSVFRDIDISKLSSGVYIFKCLNNTLLFVK